MLVARLADDLLLVPVQPSQVRKMLIGSIARRMLSLTSGSRVAVDSLRVTALRAFVLSDEEGKQEEEESGCQVDPFPGAESLRGQGCAKQDEGKPPGNPVL